MAMPVLATKLFIPRLRSRAVPRPRLVERLRERLQSGRKLTLISAPAGFGKTTLLSEWMADAQRRDPEVRVGWLSLDESDNDPSRFLTYLVGALQRADPGIGSEALPLPLPSFEPALTALINDVARSPQEIILVLDDFQLIEEETIRDALVFLLDHLPSNLHLAIASRSDPHLPVARLRAGGELTELRAADLRFTPDEAAAFLNRMVDLELSADDVAALEARTEGWIAGLQLAALSMRERSDVSGFIQGFTGSNRFMSTISPKRFCSVSPIMSANSCFAPQYWTGSVAPSAMPLPGRREAARCWSRSSGTTSSSFRWTTAATGTAITTSLRMFSGRGC